MFGKINIPALLTGTVLIILVSWFLSIRYRRYHGIARFFSFESILILLLMNYKVWFNNPFSILQIASWLLLILSAYSVISGYLVLTRKGKHDGNFENTSVLVKAGIYKYIRHPLYLSLFLLGTGIVLKDPGIAQITLGVTNLFSVWITAMIEENEMIARFGNDYRKYIKETTMFIPFLI
jgi:protein-S-isoprenylcysteine O-methyltransferase Ste14